MIDNTHIIQKQLIELSVPRGQDTFALTQRVERMFQAQLLPKLEPVFDRLAGPEQWIEIDKLELDLGDVYVHQDDDLWVEQAYTLFREKIEQLVGSSSGTTVRDRLHRQFDCLEHFLRYGYLPWWAGDTKLEELLDEQIERQPQKVLALLQSPTTRDRWILQIGERVQYALLTALSIRLPFKLKDWQNSVTVLPQRESARVYWQTTWELLQRQEGPFDVREWRSLLLRNLFASEYTSLGTVDMREQLAKLDRLLDNFGQVLASEKALQEFLTGQTNDLSETKTRTDSSLRKPSIGPDGIYVPLAGTVLVHPFLPTFFAKLNLLNGERFKDFAAQEKAVHLLYYVATRQQQPFDSETVLLKLLCGLQPETPIARKIDINPDETAESERMLEALIERWTVIQDATPDELRGTFFIREGKLVSADLGWRLTVEQTSFDVLLAKLSWGLSPIMHTWMDRMLWVDWA